MTKCLIAPAFLFSTLFTIGFAETADKHAKNDPVILEIDGTKLTLADFERKRPTGLFQARNAFADAERKILDEFVNDYLLERQAQQEHVTVDELLERHVYSTLPKDPSDESLRVYYEGLDTKESFEAVRVQILQHLRELRRTRGKAAYIQALRSQATVAFHVDSPRVSVALKNTPVRGELDAPVVLIEYADYECPFCQQIQPALDKLQAEYKGKLAFVYKDVPLPMHSHAQKAAEATRCAEAQGKYWEYHDLLFSSKQLDLGNLKDDARTLKLDTKAFDQCLDSGEKADMVKTTLSEGQSLGLQGTPSFLINGRFFSGGFTYEQFRTIVEEELAGSSGARKETVSSIGPVVRDK